MKNILTKCEIKNIQIDDPKLTNFVLQSYSVKEDINSIYADIIIDDNKLLSYMRDGKSDEKKKRYLVKILEQKLENLSKATFSNDGIFMSLISYKFIQEFFNAKLLYHLSYNDIEKPKFGMDSVFFTSNDIIIVEYKTSISNLSAASLSDVLVEGVKSLFMKESYDLATIEYCNDFLDELIAEGARLKSILDFYEKNRNDIAKLLSNKNLRFHVCIVSPLNVFTESDLIFYIKQKYLDCHNCKEGCKGEKCYRYKDIKINSAIHLQLSGDFSLPILYSELKSKLEIE